MNYTLVVNFPREEVVADGKQVTTNKKELLLEQGLEDVIEWHKKYQNTGYVVNVNYRTSYEETDPFTIANNLTKSGIDYKATLKIKNNNNYENSLKLANLIENQGYDYEITAKLKVNETSPVDFSKENTWFGEGAVYSVKPKVAVTDIMEIKTLFDRLVEAGYEASITVKPKRQADLEFATQLSAYPEGTEVIFNLRDSDYLED